MSKVTYAELQAEVCNAGGCWRTKSYSEAQVIADLGGPWRILLLDRHFSSCVSPTKKIGGLCDGVAVLPQDSNRTLVLLELKQGAEDLPKAKKQLAVGGALVEDRLPDGFAGLDVRAQVHVKKGPVSTLKRRDEIFIGPRKVGVRVVRNGRFV